MSCNSFISSGQKLKKTSLLDHPGRVLDHLGRVTLKTEIFFVVVVVFHHRRVIRRLVSKVLNVFDTRHI